jgi:hypothetical protein
MSELKNNIGISRTMLWAASVGILALSASADSINEDFNRPGNILIADQFNNRVIEINPETHAIVWQFGDGSVTAGPHSVVGTNDAERIGIVTLISGTGIPPNTVPQCTNPNGCVDNRVFIVGPSGTILWQYGKAGVTGSGPNELNTPVQATFLPNFDILITDQGNERIIEVNPKHEIVWQYGTTGVMGTADNFLNNPNSAELLANGHVLIADENNNRAVEVTREHKIFRTFTAGGTLNGVAFASRLPSGNTLITDSNNNRIVEVDAVDNIVFQYSTLDPAGNPNPLPTRAVRLRNGNTLISDQFNDRVIEINPHSQTVFTQGSLNNPGNAFNQLYGPYDAKVIGDYTGLTPPLPFPPESNE